MVPIVKTAKMSQLVGISKIQSFTIEAQCSISDKKCCVVRPLVAAYALRAFA